MSRKCGVLLLGMGVLLGACTDGPRGAARAPDLPDRDTGSIDISTLQGRFAFSNGRTLEMEEVYTADADGSNVARLTRNNVADFDPAWSPDGTRIVFRSQRDGNDEIYVMNADGSEPRNLSRDPAVDWGPSWSPDGSLIAFNSGRDGGPDLHGYVMSPTGGGARRLLDDRFIEYPAWSPDGTKIAFMGQTFEGAGGNYEIYVMNVDGTGLRQLTDHPADDGWPAWSPDGRRIAFSSIRDDCVYRHTPGCLDTGDIGEFHTLYVVNVDGSGLRRVTDAFAQFASWSPDGRYLAFTPAPGGIYVIRPDGSDLTLIPVSPEPMMQDWVG